MPILTILDWKSSVNLVSKNSNSIFFLELLENFFVDSDIWSVSRKNSISWVSCFFFQGLRRRKTSFTYLDMASGLGSTHSGPRVAKKFKNQWQKFNNPFVIFPYFCHFFVIWPWLLTLEINMKLLQFKNKAQRNFSIFRLQGVLSETFHNCQFSYF